MTIARAPRVAAAVVATVLGACYLATLAPEITLWDAGEFASAVATFGIPHPPGTPLYILLGRAATSAAAWLPVARVTSLLSVGCTAAACAVLAALVARWTRRALDGIAAGCLAGLMSSVWLNANETEVYAASLLLSALALLAADLAREREDERATLLTGYLLALAVPLHLSALVAAPAAIALATVRRGAGPLLPRIDRFRGLLLTGAALVAGGAGVVSPWPVAAGIAVLAVAALVRDARSPRSRLAIAAGQLALVALAVSVVAVLLLRARHDPAINQGNPATLDALLEVIARRQYAVPGVWPRRAPFWLQVVNLFQYADWQAGLSITPEPLGADWRRTPLTLALVALCAVGARAHRRLDETTWWGMAALFAAATVGVVVYLNLQAGPSIGYGVLPPDAEHEARERDYFFALGFAAWGVWAGMGVASLARRLADGLRAIVAPLAVAAVIVALVAANWRGVDRSRPPGAGLADRFARALLESAPPHAVLFVAGDNDSYPLWYAQHGERVRPDVTPITIPLLPADWYRGELARRERLLGGSDLGRWTGRAAVVRAIAERAAALGRPVAASIAVEPATRAAIGGGWTMQGMVYVRTSGLGGLAATAPRSLPAAGRGTEQGRSARSSPDGEGTPVLDTLALRATADRVRRLLGREVPVAEYPDGTARYLAALLACPALALEVAHGADRTARTLLDSRCNFR